ncbi:aldo/keto reductase family protein [Streptomyces gamaensis]|uniref:Aldo/keto reductase family protein n=1 Tax=Streptomyces gamaensis TaxID=1763542 RepID=A0ABW0Z1H7_9ACTN
MEFRRLGRSGLSVSAIAYGNWFTHGFQLQEEQARSCVRAALDAGITSFDTADMYSETRAEAVLGRVLAGQRREGVEIFTKVFWPTGPGANDKGLGRKHVVESCHASLRRLRTDYVDVYQAHRFDRTVPLEETMLAFADLVRQGKVLYIGVSEWTAEEICRGAELARELKVPFVSNQPQYSMLWRVPEAQVIPACRRAGVGQLAWSPLAQGVLTGKYAPGQRPPAGSRCSYDAYNPFIDALVKDEVLAAVQRLRPLAEEAGLTLAQLALAWVLRNPDVSSAVIGASRPEQIAENVKAVGVRLDEDLLSAIDEALDGVVQDDPRLTVSVGSPSRTTE